MQGSAVLKSSNYQASDEGSNTLSASTNQPHSKNVATMEEMQGSAINNHLLQFESCLSGERDQSYQLASSMVVLMVRFLFIN